MKVVLSRKGFDSENGGMPSPVLPDGTMLSMPIPSEGDCVTYGALSYGGMSYAEIISQLKRNAKVSAADECHLDPDIRKDIIVRKTGWQPTFGQVDAALGHLKNQGVGVGDLFLFFGWFRKTEWYNGTLRFIGPSSGFHAIYGYMYVEQIIRRKEDVPGWLASHPHTRPDRMNGKRNNAIFVGTNAGCLDFSEKLILTKPGCSRSIWDLPDFFRDIRISYNKNAWKPDGFHSTAKGQEFVFTPNEEALEWIEGLLH